MLTSTVRQFSGKYSNTDIFTWLSKTVVRQKEISKTICSKGFIFVNEPIHDNMLRIMRLHDYSHNPAFLLKLKIKNSNCDY
ncbi:Hypothetical protein ETEE_3602 [Edwardsiella anguillarum ET080813]|uniref:Uncharacterized protein n=1 Tax=Edwardsiella anguillarum ET080813 TaxID=667120 RepID=A0A076LTN0_9GAMM|nr:Hypothetical protein ETEE_3602 [Edwardsiella anguillarum ET080813]